MIEFPKFNLKKLIMAIVLIFAIILLVAHTFNWSNFTVDSTSMILLLLILAIPFVDLIRKLKYGDLEAEINTGEVDKAIQKVNVEYSPTSAPIDEFDDEIINLVQSDPQLGLAKLRIEIEKSLKALLSLKENQSRVNQFSPQSRLIAELVRLGVIPSDLASALKDILPLINRAVHGENIRQDDANKVANSGVLLLNNLKEIYQSLVFQPIEKTIISFDDIEMYEKSRYRVTTVIPFVENPVKNFYIWDRETLTDFLYDSAQYAEFPISIERVEEENKK